MSELLSVYVEFVIFFIKKIHYFEHGAIIKLIKDSNIWIESKKINWKVE
jgi:hypothetical protein